MDLNNKHDEACNPANHYHGYTYQNSNSFDPNLGDVTSRYSPAYQAPTGDINDVTYSNVILVPNCGNFIGHENGLLSVAEAAETIEKGISDNYNILPDHRIITTYVQPENQETATHVYSDIPTITTGTHHYDPQDDCFVHHENLTDTVNGTTQIIFRRSPNSHLFQQIPNYVLQAEDQHLHHNNQHTQELIASHETFAQSDVFHQYSNATNTTCNTNSNSGLLSVPNDDRINLIFNNSIPYDSNQHHNLLTSVGQNESNYTVVEPSIAAPPQSELVNVVLPLDDKDQLLEMTISPLLAAINDITSREGGDWNFKKETNNSDIPYYNLNDINSTNENDSEIRHHNLSSNSRYKIDCIKDEYVDINDVNRIELDSDKKPNFSDYEDEFVDDFIDDDQDDIFRNDEDDDDVYGNQYVRKQPKRVIIKKEKGLTVMDKHVPSRAWASLPTTYLKIRKLPNTSAKSEYTVFAKQCIPVATKFGPFEGDLRDINEVDLDQLKQEFPTKYPLLLIGEKILDTSNENTSNWMQFVRFARTYKQQNLILFEVNKKLFFKSTREIKPKEELRVGYKETYADKYGLNILEKDENDTTDRLWSCFECDKKFSTTADLLIHLNEHDNDIESEQVRRPKVIQTRKKIVKKRNICPVCSKSFFKMVNFKRHLKIHAGNPLVEKFLADAQNAAAARKKNRKKNKIYHKQSNKENEFECEICFKSFLNADRLKKHLIVHSPNELKPFQCSYCAKRFLKSSAMSAHIKMHLHKRNYFECLLCKERFRHTREFTSHVESHMDDGVYTCPTCGKTFPAYVTIRKHIRTIHSDKIYPCTICDKKFVIANKLKLHMLSHSDKREFLCSICGKQFKRQDKLKEHIRNIHKNIDVTNFSNDAVPIITEKKRPTTPQPPPPKPTKTQSPKASQNDYDLYIFKCHHCMLGFKRRGMLVNHLAKRHPEIQIEFVPELNLPILKAQKCFYCQYCNKVYRSNTKRKLHILKNHPGSELPTPLRQKGSGVIDPDLPNPTFTETVSTITTHPQRCEWCHKQYASRTKLTQHQRKNHPEYLIETNQDHHHIPIHDMPDEQYHPNGVNYDINSHTDLSSSFSLPSTSGFGRPNKNIENKIDVSTSSSSSSSLNAPEFPQLFEEIDYINLRPVKPSKKSLHNDYMLHHGSGGSNL